MSATVMQSVPGRPLIACRITTGRALQRPVAPVLVRVLRHRLDPALDFDSDAVETALHEAVVNAAIHGNLAVPPPRAAGLAAIGERARLVQARLGEAALARRLIALTVTRHAMQIQITVRDQGAGFAVQGLEQPDPAQSSGRGIHLMRALARNVSFAGGGREVSLAFDLVQAGAA